MLFLFGLVLFSDNLIVFPIQTNLIYILLLIFGIVFVQSSRNQEQHENVLITT